MIECDTCKCWQHGPCVGLWNEKVSLALSLSHWCRLSDSDLPSTTNRTAPTATSASCVDRPGTALAGELSACLSLRPSLATLVRALTLSLKTRSLLRKAYRKNAAPPAPTHRRSPSLSSTSQHPSAGGRNKPRESADAALVSAFLASEIVDRPSGPADRESPEPTPAATTGKAGKKDEPVAKKRSTMNSRDAAYDDAIALSILGPGSAAMRARLARTKGEGSAGSASGEEGEEGEDG